MTIEFFENRIRGNDYIKFIVTILTGILMGYTLQPIPLVLEYYLNNKIVQFIILFAAGLIIIEKPLNHCNIINNAMICTIILIIFDLLRFISPKSKFYRPYNPPDPSVYHIIYDDDDSTHKIFDRLRGQWLDNLAIVPTTSSFGKQRRTPPRSEKAKNN